MPGTETVTLNVVEGNSTKPFTINVENKNFINSIISVGENNTITNEQMLKLQNVARLNGDTGILEYCDLNKQEIINLANVNGYDKYYDIKLSSDGEFFLVKIKDAGMLYRNPTLRTIKKDFRIPDNVLVTKNGIPYGNEEVIRKAASKTLPDDDGDINYDNARLSVEDTIRIPVSKATVQNSPSGFWGRLLN